MMPTKKLSADTLPAAIGYLYLYSFCPPTRTQEFLQAGQPLRQGLAFRSQLPEAQFFQAVVPEACRRIVAYHQHTRQPDEKLVSILATATLEAFTEPEALEGFQRRMAQVAGLPGRAKAENRLRHDRGCQFCAAPCRYGYFVLVSKPYYPLLQKLLKSETMKGKYEQDPLQALWSFAMAHLWRTLGTEQGYIHAAHLGNLAYCLLVLGASRSRYPLPEDEYRLFQQANQALIQRWTV